MVEEVKRGNRNYYKCEECGYVYSEKVWAEKCQKWCKEHKSCNLDITKHASYVSGNSI